MGGWDDDEINQLLPSRTSPSPQKTVILDQIPQVSIWKARHLWRASFCVLGLTLFSSASGYDAGLLNGLQALETWNDFMNHPTGARLGFINATYWIGTFVASIAAARVSNQYGRRKGIWLGFLVLLIGVLLQTMANHASIFILARFIVGMSSGFLSNAPPLLLNEIAYPPHRPVANALFMCGHTMGGVTGAWITFATRDWGSSWSWRLPSLMALACPLLALPALWMAPESPRWLMAVDRHPEARQTLARLHAAGDIYSPVVAAQMKEIRATLAAETSSSGSDSSSSGYREMIRTPGNRHRLLITVSLGFYAQWVGNGVVSYYLSMVLDSVGVTETRDQLLVSGYLGVWNLFFAVVGALSVERAGRRALFLLSGAIMLVSYIIITVLSGVFAETGSVTAGTAVIPFLFIYFGGYVITLTPLLTAYPCEIWPFALRARGMTVTWLSVVVGIVFNIFVNPIALDAFGWKYYFVFIVFLVCYEATVYFAYPETRGYSLEQIAVVFDKERGNVSSTGYFKTEEVEGIPLSVVGNASGSRS